MSRTECRQGLDLGSCVDQVKGFVRDRCSGVRAFLKLDKPGHSTLAESSSSSQTASAPESEVSGFPCTNFANSRPTPTSIGTQIDQYTSREELGRATWLLLHTLAAQYPDTPSKQQRKDVTTMVRAVQELQLQSPRQICNFKSLDKAVHCNTGEPDDTYIPLWRMCRAL